MLGGVAEVVGSNLARGKIFTASIGSVDSLYPYIYILVLHQTSFTCELKSCHPLKKNQYTTCTASVVDNISASRTSFLGDVSVAQLVASVFGVVLGGVAEVVGSNLARGKIFTASIGSVDSLYPFVFIYYIERA